MKNTKIVCTIGPASNKRGIVKKMLMAGMNVARLNFSHGDYPDHAKLIKTIRSASSAVGQPVALLQDLQGPRIRTGDVPDEGIEISAGDSVTLVSQEEFATWQDGIAIPTQYPELARDVFPGGVIYIQDGLIGLEIVETTKTQIRCTVVQGGVVKSHKGINAPGATIRTDVITEKDMADLAFGVEQGVDYVALSFVKDARDIKQLRKLLPENSPIKIIAKIERAEAVKNFDKILAVVDGIMVARGDLGVELGPAEVPVLQKDMIAQCVAASKPVIVATQMLESMTQNPRPTRAEASDVANAAIDHTDAIMLSAESATGAYPVQAVQTMTDIVENVEASKYDDPTTEPIGRGMAAAGLALAQSESADAIVLVTNDVELIAEVASFRPAQQRIFALVTDEQLQRHLLLHWGVYPILIQDNLTESKRVHTWQLIAKNRDLLAVDARYVMLSHDPDTTELQLQVLAMQ